MIKHGTNKGWEAGCRRDCCDKARQLYTHRRRLVRYGENGSSTQSTARVARHIKSLREDYGWTFEAIAEESGISSRSLRNWSAGTGRANNDKIDKVMSVPLEHMNVRNSKVGIIEKIGIERRLQAAALRGFSSRWFADRANTSPSTITRLRDRDSRVENVLSETARKIREAYTSSLLLPEPEGVDADKVREHAKSKGWLPSGVWSDIDDPQCIPESLNDPVTEAAMIKLRKLFARGFAMKQVAARGKINHSNAFDILYDRGNKSIRQVTQDKINAVYEELSQVPDPEGYNAEKNRRLARERGWDLLLESR